METDPGGMAGGLWGLVFSACVREAGRPVLCIGDIFEVWGRGVAAVWCRAGLYRGRAADCQSCVWILGDRA